MAEESLENHQVGGFDTSNVDVALLEKYWTEVQGKLRQASQAGDNIVVVTRTRPFNNREKELRTTNCCRVLADNSSGQQQVWVVNPSAPEAGPVKFSFDFCFDSFDPSNPGFINQKTVFDLIGVDLLAKTWAGFNASIFAYGQTGSGKTYSIMGYGEEKGLIPRICETLFHFIDKHGQTRGLQVDATYLEIYQEKIMDLLNPHATSGGGPLKPKDRLKMEAKRKKLMADKGNPKAAEEAREILRQLAPSYQGDKGPKVREDPTRGVVVDNLKRFAVTTYSDCNDLLEEGLSNRTTASTAMNSTSSRSHAVFTLEITEKTGEVDAVAAALSGKSPSKSSSGKSKKGGGGGTNGPQVTKVTLIDLAGSERAKSADTTGERLREGGAINKSLSVLGNVISLLAKNSKDMALLEEELAAEATAAGTSPTSPEASAKAKKKLQLAAENSRHIPFRDSVLTWILRDSLVGNSKTIMLAAISPAAVNFHETLSTLRFANQAKLIKTKAVNNEDPTTRLIRELRDEIEQLKAQLASGGGGGGGIGSGGGGGGGSYGADGSFEDYMASMNGNSTFAHSPDRNHGNNFGGSPSSEHGGGDALSPDGTSARERDALQALSRAEGRRAAAEANMLDLRAKLNHRRRVVRLHRLGDASSPKSDGDGADQHDEDEQAPYLTFLNDDPSINGQMRIYVARGQRMRIGTSNAQIEQDIQVAGLGVTPETAIFTMHKPPGDDSMGVLFVAPAQPNAQVRVNGTLLKYKAGADGNEPLPTIRRRPTDGGDWPLAIGDRVVLGTCAHVLLVCEPEASARISRADLLAKGQIYKLSNYEQAIREVVLQRAESQSEYGKRLAGLVVNRLRLPRARAVFAATMVRALRGVNEANEVAVAMGSNKRFKVHLGGTVDHDHLFSLRQEDVLPLHKNRVTVQILVDTHTYVMLGDHSGATPQQQAALHQLQGWGGKGGQAPPEPWCTCELDEFLDLVEDLKATLLSCRAVAESVVTPVSPHSATSPSSASFENTASSNGAYGGDLDAQLGGLSPTKEGNASNRGAGAITRAFFMAADADGDGVINRDELVEAASALGLTPSETEMDALFRQYDVDSNDELSLGEFDQFVRDQLCARFDDCLSKMSGRKRHNEGRATAEIGAHLEQHLTALQSQLQLAVKMREFDIAVELEENVRVVQAELLNFKKQRALMNDSSELQHADLLRMKEEALHYSADLRRSLMDLADSHAALLMALEPLMDGGRGADAEELEGVAAASFTAARVGEAASQVSHDLQLLVQGNAAEDAANDELAEAAAAALIAGRTISANAKKALEDRVARNSAMSALDSPEGGPGVGPKMGASKRMFTPDDDVLFRDVSHHRNIVNRLVGTAQTMSRTESEEPETFYNPLLHEAAQTPDRKPKSKGK